MRKRTLYWILAALFAASAIYAPFDDNRDSGLPLTIVTIIALVALAVGFAMAARKVDQNVPWLAGSAGDAEV